MSANIGNNRKIECREFRGGGNLEPENWQFIGKNCWIVIFQWISSFTILWTLITTGALNRKKQPKTRKKKYEKYYLQQHYYNIFVKKNLSDAKYFISSKAIQNFIIFANVTLYIIKYWRGREKTHISRLWEFNISW